MHIQMDSRLRSLIVDYLAAVTAAVDLLKEAGIAMPESNVAWACNGLPHNGVLPGGVPYFKHGYGIGVELEAGLVDFDFGQNGETNGFDFWRLAHFAGDRLSQYIFTSKEELRGCFQLALDSGAFVPSTYMLHYLRK
jgi:hypothetical protein